MKLSDTINSLLFYVQANPGQTQAAKLARGLAIGVQITTVEDVHYLALMLRRAGQPPSETEAKTVLAHWPGGPQPARNFTAYSLERDGITYHYLQANWRSGQVDP